MMKGGSKVMRPRNEAFSALSATSPFLTLPLKIAASLVCMQSIDISV